jgi:hypothetical protein
VDGARADDQEKTPVVGEDEPMDISVLGSSAKSAAGEGRGRVSTTLRSDVFCMSCELGGLGDRRASPASIIDVSRTQKMGKKSGAPYTPIRCAFAFLVTPKLPAKRGEVLTDALKKTF